METISTLLAEYTQTRQRTVSLCEPLSIEDHIAQPTVDVSPPKWHLGHSTWFFENFILAQLVEGYRLYDQKYNYCFNSYYESQGKRVNRFKRGDMTRPTVAETMRYRQHVDAQMNELLIACEQGRLSEEKAREVEFWTILGCNHEQQHQELLLTDLKYSLGLQFPLFPVYAEKKPGQLPVHYGNGHAAERYIDVPEGLRRIGYEGDGFHFDNEKGAHQVFLHAFRLQDRLITAEEYLAFMEDGGYRDFRFWLMEGWEWVNANKAEAPLYWHNEGGTWYHYTLHGYEPVDLHAPVTHVNYYEAEAFASWKGKRLLTEFEWEAACKTISPAVPEEANFMEKERFGPAHRRPGDAQLVGDCWEWTSSAYLPYPYYKQAKGALGEYNGKFMVNQMTLRGGSCSTPRGHFRISYRNFFHADKQWQFTGIRLAESI